MRFVWIESNIYLIDYLRGGGINTSLLNYLDFPMYISLETVMGCNARCAMCGINDWKRNKNYMEDNLFYKISDEIIENRDKVERVSIYLGGEPLLDKKLSDRIRYLKKGIDNIYFTTNAALFDKDRIFDILDSGVSQIDVSFHSVNKDKYERIMKNLSYDRTLKNVEDLILIRNKYNYKTRIRIRAIEMTLNRSEMEDLINFWNERLDYDRGDIVYAKDLNYQFVSNRNLRNTDILGSLDKHANDVEVNDKPCYALWNTATILSDGRLALCCVDMGRKHTFGDLNNESLKELWKSDFISGIRNNHLNSGRGCMNVCRDCNTWL